MEKYIKMYVKTHLRECVENKKLSSRMSHVQPVFIKWFCEEIPEINQQQVTKRYSSFFK